MEDDWSSGYSGYAFDTPLFLSSLAQEAESQWQKVSSKKAAKQPNSRAHTACPCHIHKGRYGALSDDNYDLDVDYDLPMMMLRCEEGDVPAGIASPGGAVFVHEAATARVLQIGAEEFQKIHGEVSSPAQSPDQQENPKDVRQGIPVGKQGRQRRRGRKGVPTGE